MVVECKRVNPAYACWCLAQSPMIRPIALTAYARAEDRMRAVMPGFQHHVVKPIEPAELITMVASLSRMRALETAIERHGAGRKLARHSERQSILLEITRLVLANNLDELALTAAVFDRGTVHLHVLGK